MLRSMTAYGRSMLSVSFGRLVVEVQSVNKRHLDIIINLPRELSHFETYVRRWVKEEVERGQVRVTVHAAFSKDTPLRAVANMPLARELRGIWQEIANEVGVELTSEALTQVLLAQESELVRFEEVLDEEQTYKSALETVIKQALAEYVRMQEREGKALYEDIVDRAESLESAVSEIDELKAKASEKFREKLINRVQEMLADSVEISEERIIQEIALLAEKGDISEELTRIRSHLKQMKELMATQGRSVGKTLDFIAQELHRESNTVGSKNSDAEVSKLVVRMKTEIERIREQVQNVE